jgi:hypothetical protein
MSRLLEAIPRVLLLTRIFGSPVIVKFERLAGDDR